MILAFLVLMTLSCPEYSEHKTEIAEPDSIQSNFILGMDDLYRQTGLYHTSLDRMSAMLHSDLYGAYGPQPEFSLNGIPFNASFFGTSFSQLIPVPFTQIHDIKYTEGLTFNQGTYYQNGAIQLTSNLPDKGLTLFGSGQYGHNGNEPGPWVFDPDRLSPNIERFGPWVDAGLNYRSESWYLKGVSRFHSYKNMHPFVQSRIINLRIIPGRDELPDVRLSSSLMMAEAGIILNRTDLTLQYIQSELEDEFFLIPLSREVLTNLQSNQFSLAGETRINNRFKAHYLYQENRNQTSELENRFEHKFDWAQSKRIINGSLAVKTSDFEALIGSKLEFQQNKAPGLHNGNRRFLSLYFHQKKKFNRALNFESGQTITLHRHQPAYQAFIKASAYYREKASTSLSIDYSELHPESFGMIEPYILAGYELFDRLEISSQLPGLINKLRHLSFTGRQSMTFDKDFRLDFQMKLIQYFSFSVPFQQSLFHPHLSTIPGFYTLYDNETGSRLHVQLSSEHHPNQKFSQKWTLNYRSTFLATEQLEKYWEMTPSFMATYEADYKPFNDLELLLVTQYRSTSHWHEFELLDGEFARTFSNEAPVYHYPYSHILPRHLLIHLGVSKWFWNQRVRGTAMLKNLLNRPYQTHPIGTKEEFGYLVRLELQF